MNTIRFLVGLACFFCLSFSIAEPVTTTTLSESIEASAPAKPDATPDNLEAAQPKKIVARIWNLQDADILSVINEVSLETGKNFIVDPRVTGKISLVSTKPIQPTEVYNIFLSVLELLGYSAIPSGNVVKIIPNMESGEFATRVAHGGAPGSGDEVVVRVIPLENVSASQLIPVIRPMLPQWSNVSAYTPGNVLIVLGRAANINRIINVIHNIDQNSGNDIDVVPLKHATASQMVNVLTNLQNSARASGDTTQVSIGADERSNSILLSGNKAARLHMKYLIGQLDRPGSGAQGNTEVLYLRYLQAKAFAPILGKIAANMQGKEGGTQPATTQSSSNTNKPATPENMTSIQAEPSTNSLIITAPPTMMQALNVVVAKLDIRPAQVQVEGIIVEISQDDLKNLGIQWGALTNVPVGGGADQLINGTPGSTADFPTLGAGTIGIIPHTQIRAILSALENKNGVNILSTPSIVVLDNHKATLEIGQDVPEQSGQYATTGSSSTVTPFNTITRKPVTLKLDVVPQINLGNSVRLGINLQNDSLQNPDNPGLNPIINTSNIKNSVIVNSDDILVLGGLMSNSLIESENKVPILGDIPVVGKLFQQKSRKMEKRSLMVFIKPTIMYNTEDASVITINKYTAARNAQINWPVDLTNEGNQKRQNILPPWGHDVELPKPFLNSQESKS